MVTGSSSSHQPARGEMETMAALENFPYAVLALSSAQRHVQTMIAANVTTASNCVSPVIAEYEARRCCQLASSEVDAGLAGDGDDAVAAVFPRR